MPPLHNLTHGEKKLLEGGIDIEIELWSYGSLDLTN